MKSHDLAHALQTLARLLKSGPDVELSELKLKDNVGALRTSQDLAVNLSTLVSLSSVDKSKWVALIREHSFPIDVRPRDAARDVLGKLFTYLEANEEAQQKLKASAKRPTGQASPELMKALDTLLKN
jgi:hypothetical protein